jgi:cyclophilin family peptidyl-prolyl cis-trans isomerase
MKGCCAVDSICRRIFLIACLMSVSCVPLLGANWTQPTPDELKMTSDPAAPDAPAVYLFREEIVNDKLHSHTTYARIKILSEKGKEDFSEIEIPYEKDEAGVSISEVEGRTIEPDGTVVPFTGKPYNKELLKSGDMTVMEKVFSLPDIRVGSIIEYRYLLTYEGNYFMPPTWILQKSVFVHRAHYHFVPTDTSQTITSTDSQGHENVVSHLVYFPLLPPGVKVRSGLDGFDLVVDNIPAAPDEPYMLPVGSFTYRLIFYYTPYPSEAEFWTAEAKYWSKSVNRFAEPSDRIRAAVAKTVAPGDSDEQKLQKIYAAVMTLENTDFTRQHSAAENKAEGQKTKNAADIWDQKRGTGNEINRLFIAMARAAGMKAYAMILTSRDQSLLNRGYLYWGQLTDEIAIVNVGGKEMYFDPGERYCEYDKLDWIHTQMLGFRQKDDGTELTTAPPAKFSDNITVRHVDVTLGPDGKLQGQIQITMTGVEALRWRQKALLTDEQSTKTALEKQVQGEVPDGVKVKMNHILALNDSTVTLMAILDVSGNLGTATGKRVFFPAAFFETKSKPMFASEKRENAVDLRYPSAVQDVVTITLAPGLSVESLPKGITTVSPIGAEYKSVYGDTANSYKQVRLLAVANTLFATKEYPQLRGFYQDAATQDQQQVVLQRMPTATLAPGSAKGQ